MSDRQNRRVNRRDVIAGGLGVALGVGVTAAAAAITDDTHTTPSSAVLSATADVYDESAGVCGVALVVDVAPSERVVIQNSFSGDSDRTVETTGRRTLKTVVRPESRVLVYAVNLDANTSTRLQTYRVSDECSLTEVTE